MEPKYEKYKGLHPGTVLKRELDKRNMAQRPFAISIGEFPQTINAILKGKRSLNTATALKIEHALALEEGTLMILQVYFDIQKIKEKDTEKKLQTPNTERLRKSLFWDTDINKIQWKSQSAAVINRIFERGNIGEKKEIVKFYGSLEIRTVLNAAHAKMDLRAKKLHYRFDPKNKVLNAAKDLKPESISPIKRKKRNDAPVSQK
ncbi:MULTISPECIES: helix-turn-helix transcriptional regulator [Flavobacterium]|uniref:helix-turn-helix transcriptional regulator n=1 Tax=Flavobacterium TaxID=237 RepID=UPI002114D095|nr:MULTISPECIES: plasmid maintenance system antidote protein [Flavobacterium]UUF12390.1 plasmid maintenance system antidote protein [Flavobacterium panici]